MYMICALKPFLRSLAHSIYKPNEKWEMTKSLTPSCMAFERFTISLWVAHLIYEMKNYWKYYCKGRNHHCRHLKVKPLQRVCGGGKKAQISYKPMEITYIVTSMVHLQSQLLGYGCAGTYVCVCVGVKAYQTTNHTKALESGRTLNSWFSVCWAWKSIKIRARTCIRQQ